MGKKLSRAKRKELREQGVLEPPAPTRAAEPERTARRAQPASAPATRDETDEIGADPREDPPAPTRATRRDRTMLVLLALTAGAAIIFWLTQRSPKNDSKMIAVPPPMGAPTGTAKP